MLFGLFLAHLAGIGLSIWAGRFSWSAALATAALAPAATAVWAASTLISGNEAPAIEVTWVDGLDLSFRFFASPVALMMTLLVSGIGALVFVYAIGYFNATAEGATRFPATLLAFSTSMLGLVWADSIWTLFIFWELTSVTSFLLVGHKSNSPAVLAAARRALMITGGGGLVLLAGLIVLANDAGTVQISELGATSGSSLAAVLIMIGAATKSAQVPFHVWLPGAMAAPTPVSAYLHSATMVKAGVLIVALVGPAFDATPAWKWVGLIFGTVSILWGAIGALRQVDAKLILAWGTVSQLGLMIVLLSLGTGKAVFAAISIVFAHALFKAALFMVVGEVDVRTGTRDITKLGGLSRSMPVATAVATLAGLSMAGVPPLLGFAAKEAAVEAVLKLSGAEQIVAGIAIIGGSVLTVAYTTRFLLGVFGPGPSIDVAPVRSAMALPSALLAAAGVIGYVLMGNVNNLVRPAAVYLNVDSQVYSLLRWPGITTAFLISIGIVASGITLGVAITRMSIRVPKPLGAESVDKALDGVLTVAKRVTATVQHGSLPVYLLVMMLVATSATVPFFVDIDTSTLVWWDSPSQGLLVLGLVAAAGATPFVKNRLGAAIALGAVGTAVSGLFVVHGAPDLALTQLLVETIIVVGFVIGLGHLRNQFPQSNATWRATRIVVAAAGSIGVMAALAASGANPTGEPAVEALTSESVDVGGGNNVVNVILTDVRALDTLGEVVVLATVALGILALGGASRATNGRSTSTPSISQQGVQIVSPLAGVLALYLLFAGHNLPGGGFAAGLVIGAIVALRVFAGLSEPRHAIELIAGGMLIIMATALVPLLWGDPLLDQKIVSVELPLLGKVKSGSALPFDIGVTAVVVGLVLAVLDGLHATRFVPQTKTGDSGTTNDHQEVTA